MTFPPSKHISPFSTFCTLTCSMRNRPVRRLYAICCRTCVTRWVKVICATVICTPSKNTCIQHPKPLVEGLPYSVLVPPSNLGDIIFLRYIFVCVFRHSLSNTLFSPFHMVNFPLEIKEA